MIASPSSLPTIHPPSQVPITREDTGERIGTVTVTLVAEAALRALPRPGVAMPGTAALPYASAAGRPPGVSSSITNTNYPGGYY
jgi:hypothetical protein